MNTETEKIQNMQNITKTYYWTNQFENTFPPEFMASKNKRFIVVEECKAVLKDVLVGVVIMHADFIQRDHYMDYACCFVNEEANRDTAKYDYKGYQKNFKIWFTDLSLQPVEVKKFTLRMWLIY